jgi:hypothetical protein
MKHPCLRALLMAAACAAAAPALALDLASSTASSASSAGSASVGSLSDSLQSSSQSSAGPRQMADGEYRVIQVVQVAHADGPAGSLQLTLQAVQPPASGDVADSVAAPPQGERWELRLPLAVVQREGLDAGHLLRAAQRPYGVAFAHASQARPFFLVLSEDWQQQLPARPVSSAPGT